MYIVKNDINKFEIRNWLLNNFYFPSGYAGSALLVAETVLDEKRISPVRGVLQSLTMTEGKQRSGLEYQQLLEKYGFTSVQIKITGNLLDVILCFKKVSTH